jgi:hypothetical protein
MSADNLPGIHTSSDLISTISRREHGLDQMNQHLLDLLEQINQAQRTLDADSYMVIQATAAICHASIKRGDKAATGFTSDLLGYLVDGGKGQDFLNQPQFAHWKDLQLDSIIKPEVISMLEEPPTLEMPILEINSSHIHGHLEAGVEHVVASEAVDKHEEILSENANVKKLLENPTLWITNGSDGQKYTSLGSLAVLLVGNGWNETNLQLAKIALRQTIIPAWQQQNKIPSSEPVGIRLDRSGNNLMISLDQVKGLTKFMQENLGLTVRSPYRVVKEPINNWPSLAKKKANRN